MLGVGRPVGKSRGLRGLLPLLVDEVAKGLVVVVEGLAPKGEDVVVLVLDAWPKGEDVVVVLLVLAAWPKGDGAVALALAIWPKGEAAVDGWPKAGRCG